MQLLKELNIQLQLTPEHVEQEIQRIVQTESTIDKRSKMLALLRQFPNTPDKEIILSRMEGVSDPHQMDNLAEEISHLVI